MESFAVGQCRFVVVSGRHITVELIRPAVSQSDAWICWALPERLMMIVPESDLGEIAAVEPRD